MKHFLLILFICGLQDKTHAQIPLVGAGALSGGLPYPNQVTDIGIACLQYDSFAKKICKPTPTEWAIFRPKCDQWRLYCKGLKGPSATTPDPSGLVPPPPPDVCPQIYYCSSQKAQYDRTCARPPDQDSYNFCKNYQPYCANVPPDTDGTCAQQVQKQRQFDQQQFQAMLAQQRAIAAATGANQPFNGNPFPFSASQSLPGTYSNTGIIGK